MIASPTCSLHSSSLENQKYWDIEVSKYWNMEILKCCNIEIGKYYNIETLKYWISGDEPCTTSPTWSCRVSWSPRWPSSGSPSHRTLARSSALVGRKNVWTYELTAALKIIFHELRIQHFPSSEVTIMLAITIFATIVGDMLPVTDSTPLIGEFALD